MKTKLTLFVTVLAAALFGMGCASTVQFDPNNKDHVRIETEIRKTIQKPVGELTQADYAKVKQLAIEGGGVTDISPLANLKHLESLRIWESNVSDLTPLANLKELKKLVIGRSDVVDLTSLANLKELNDLYLSQNKITNIEPLSGLNQLETLNIKFNKINDLTPLSGLKELRELHVWENAGLTWAEIGNIRLVLPECRDIRHATQKTVESVIRVAVGKLKGELTQADYAKVSKLVIEGTGGGAFSDHSQLSNLSNLTELTISHGTITDLRPLSGLVKLEKLNLFRNEISDLTPLTGLKQLKLINLRDNPRQLKTEIDKLQKALPKCEILH